VASRKPYYRDAYFVSLCLTAFVCFTVIFFNPVNAPASVRGLEAWLRAHWTVFIWIMVALTIVDFVLAFDRFQTGTNKKLAALEEQVAELKGGGHDLNRKI
jgi:hypothetical protein